MTNEDFLKAFKCNHYQAITYSLKATNLGGYIEDERPRHRCTKFKIRCEGPCDDIDISEAGTDAIEFVETWNIDG